ncbi:MAG: hypothetical protein ABIY70_03780 [Capsulimonas sp.]|uniref:hypothetical protein n=1 Tax=Capsulimonas sp. TaxID=2494211 RepID=UPI003267A5B1
MRSSDLENDIKQLLASTKARNEFDGIQRQLSCRVNVVCHYQIGVLADKVNMTRTALAERLLEQATAIAWEAAGLGELSDIDIHAIKAPAREQEIERAKGRVSMASDETKFSRINCIKVVFRHLGLEVGRAKDSGALAVSHDTSTRICCLTSKDYEAEKGVPDGERYWFTIYENQLENIQRAKQAYVAFGCGSVGQIVVVPSEDFSKWCQYLPPYTQGKVGWHVRIQKDAGKWELRREGRGESPIDIAKFVI